jgi:hypothetical protein
MLKKYEVEMRAHPEVESYYCFCVGRDLAYLGQAQESREWLDLAAARDSRNSWRLWFWRVASRMGKTALRACRRLVPVSPPPSD